MSVEQPIAGPAHRRIWRTPAFWAALGIWVVWGIATLVERTRFGFVVFLVLTGAAVLAYRSGRRDADERAAGAGTAGTVRGAEGE